MGKDKPEIDKIYIIYTTDGKYQIRRYVKGYVSGCGLTADLSLLPYKCKGEIDEGFITLGGWIGRKSDKVACFLELPQIPKEFELHNSLSLKIAKYEAEIQRLKKQLKEETIKKQGEVNA